MATAQESAQEELGAAEDIERDQYLVFRIVAQEFAIQAARVQEISKVVATTQVPTAPPYIEGILNLRGQLATVINFRRKFGLGQRDISEDTRIIIVEHGGFPIGILVDSVEEVIRIPDEKVQGLPEEAATTVSRDYITGIGMLENRLIVVLDADKLLTKSELAEAEAARLSAGIDEIKKTA